MDHKHLLLHELLQQDQEPFHLNTYISDKRSKLNYPSPVADLRLTTAAQAGALLVPSRTAAVLVEAAMRIEKRRRWKHKMQIMNVGISLFGSIQKILKHRRKNRVLRNCDLNEVENSDEIRVSCSCTGFDLGPSTSTNRNEKLHEIGDFELHGARCSSARRSPDLCSPARRIKQDKEKSAEFHNVKGVEEEKCSPVSVLEAFFEEEEEEDREGNYASIERVRQQLLERLRRFERLASLDLDAPEYEHLFCKEGGSDTSSPLQSPLKMLRGAKYSVVDEMDVKSPFHEWIVLRSSKVVEEMIVEIELQILCGLLQEFII